MKKINNLNIFVRSLSILLFIVLTFGLSLSSKADSEIQDGDREHVNNDTEEREHISILEKIRNAEVKVPKPDEVTPEDFCDDNPDHHYFYDPRNRRWFWVTEDEPRNKHWAPFDYEAGTGKYIECEGDKWYSFAPVYDGKRIQIYTDEEQGITTVYDENVIEVAEDEEGVDSKVIEMPVPEAPASESTVDSHAEPFAENISESEIEQRQERADSRESVNTPEISAKEGESEQVKAEEGQEDKLTATEPQIQEIHPEEETLIDSTSKAEEKPAMKQAELTVARIIIPSISVPGADEKVNECDIDCGKTVDSVLSYFFVLKGWDFDEFLELVKYSGMRILYFSKNDSLLKENDEVIEVDHNGDPVLENDVKLDIDNYSEKPYPLRLISDSWNKHEEYLNRVYQVNNSMLLLFPYSFFAYLEEAIKIYCQTHNIDYAILIGEDACKVTFTIFRDDYKFKILSVGNDR